MEKSQPRNSSGRVALAQWNLTNQYSNLQQILQILGDDPATLSAYQSQLSNIGQQLANPLFVGSSILDLLIEEELLEQEAARRSIEVSEGDIDTFIEERLGFFGEQEAATAEPEVMAPQAQRQLHIPKNSTRETSRPTSRMLERLELMRRHCGLKRARYCSAIVWKQTLRAR